MLQIFWMCLALVNLMDAGLCGLEEAELTVLIWVNLAHNFFLPQIGNFLSYTKNTSPSHVKGTCNSPLVDFKLLTE